MKRILIVDDEEIVVELYATVLGAKGYDVFIALNGEEAVTLYRKLSGEDKKPDIVIMDYRMPLKDGIVATEEILSFDNGARIIFASADATIKEEVSKAGALIFMAKPIDLKKLIFNIEGLFDELCAT